MRGFPPTASIQIGQSSFDYLVAGANKPSVVLINGSGGPIEGWHKLFGALSKSSTTFAYNRPGLGRSTKPTRPQTASAMVEDLHALLRTLQVPKPWVLVGHSFGGLVANLFARQHPSEVCGGVMLEATAPDDVSVLRQYETNLQKAVAWIANRLLPLDRYHETLHAADSVAELSAAPTFPPIPLTVITGSKPAMARATNSKARALRAQHQRSLVALSPLGKQIVATKSGHFPQFTEPDLVLSVIQALNAETQAYSAAKQDKEPHSRASPCSCPLR